MRLLALFAIISLGAATTLQNGEGKRTITQVVEILQGMLEKSKEEGDDERKIFAKFKCYCDTNEAEKNDNIKDLTEEIALLESDIEEIQGGTGGLSNEVADLKVKMADNEQAQQDAKDLRDKENTAFKAEKSDLEQAIKQMKAALSTLAKVGADQTASTGADNKQFMAGKGASLLQEGLSEVQSAIRVAQALMSPADAKVANAFLQAPFTGTYTSQSGAVMGIIKNMRDTFEANLEDAIKTEKDAKEAYDIFMKLKKEAFEDMSKSYAAKQKSMGGNDGDLSTKKGQLQTAKKSKQDDEDFLETLLPMCEKKAAQYEKRKALRTNEEAAIAQAISILNSDDAFATFATTDATSTGATKASFLQLRSIRQHEDVRGMAQALLQKAAKDVKSTRLSKVVAALQAENPFDTVLDEIDKMIELIKEEEKEDQKNKKWCEDERSDNHAELKDKKSKINGLDSKIDSLEKAINDPKTGLKAQIEKTEDDLVKNDKSQKDETADRLEENMAYQKDVKNLVAAQAILKRGLSVLETYYDDLAKKLEAAAAFVQKKEDPAPPSADLNMEGQSGKGNEVIEMLEFILSEANAEEMKAHADEESAQADYEDSMTSLKKTQASLEDQLADLQDDLADKEEKLLKAKEDLKVTTEDKESIEAYLAKIKPGCDFIKDNYQKRKESRETETKALNKATGLIKGTPAYKKAVTAATNESYGDCKEDCVKDKDHVKCKACMADVTIPAYCAGHKGTAGC